VKFSEVLIVTAVVERLVIVAETFESSGDETLTVEITTEGIAEYVPIKVYEPMSALVKVIFAASTSPPVVTIESYS
jgi:hypothetical protein